MIKHTKVCDDCQKDLDLMDRVSHQASPLYTNACLDSIDDHLATIEDTLKKIYYFLQDMYNGQSFFIRVSLWLCYSYCR